MKALILASLTLSSTVYGFTCSTELDLNGLSDIKAVLAGQGCNRYSKTDAKNLVSVLKKIANKEIIKPCFDCEDKKVEKMSLAGNIDYKKIPGSSDYRVTLNGEPMDPTGLYSQDVDSSWTYHSLEEKFNCPTSSPKTVDINSIEQHQDAYKRALPSQKAIDGYRSCVKQLEAREKELIESALQKKGLSFTLEMKRNEFRAYRSDVNNAVINENRTYKVDVKDASGNSASLILESASYLMNEANLVTIKGSPGVEATYDSLGNLLTPGKPEIPDRQEFKTTGRVTAGLSTGFAFPLMVLRNSITGKEVVDVYAENGKIVQVGSTQYLDKPSAPECSYEVD